MNDVMYVELILFQFLLLLLTFLKFSKTLAVLIAFHDDLKINEFVLMLWTE